MRIKYFPSTLSTKELSLIKIILDIELIAQRWHTTTFSGLLFEEIRLDIQ